LEAAAAERGSLSLLAGTGAASLTDAITLTRAAFELGYDGVIVVPPFYYKGAPLEGLFAFYFELVSQAVPDEGHLLFYHIPQVSGVGVEPELIRRLRFEFPNQVVGIKDSSGSVEHMQMLCQTFEGFQVFTGNDALLSETLDAGGVGAITALSNVVAAKLRAIYDAHTNGEVTLQIEEEQAWLTATRKMLQERGFSLPSTIKTALRLKGLIPNDYVRPPLRRLEVDDEATVQAHFGL
jgi:4-hydroxy-tetrahydrodipicolinate synthase